MQNLIAENIFTELYNTLLEEFKSMNSEVVYNLYLETESKVKDWKYATDTYFTTLPYDVEISRHKRGRLLKSADPSNPKIRVNTFGFDGHDRLILSEWPFSNDGRKFGYSTSCKLHLAEAIKIYAIHRYIDNKPLSSLSAVSVFKSLDDRTKISFGVNGLGDTSWFIELYHYSDKGVLQKIVAYDPVFNLTTEYNMIHDEKGLEQITTGNGSVWWKRN